MNHELIERLAIVLTALELTAEELAAVVIEDCRNRGDDEADAERLRREMARLIEPPLAGWGPSPRIRSVAVVEESPWRGSFRCGAVSSLALGPSVCQRVVDHDGPHVEADTSWMED